MSGILPKPSRLEPDPDTVSVTAPTTVVWDGPWCRRVNGAIERQLAAADVGELRVSIDAIAAGAPEFGVDESYKLEKAVTGWTLTAATSYGALAGVTSLAQLYGLGDPASIAWIEDKPAYPWRGVMIDVARHFIPFEKLLSVLDGMAGLKLNVLHLHLTDDQGFRLPSAAYPKLASEEHFTREELRTLVNYAADRGIRVIPEVDIPGHVTCWLVAYPEWGYQQIDTTERFGVHKACLDPSSEQVYAALEALFTELGEVFPDRYVHIGGDEVHPAWWQEDPAVAALRSEQNLDDVRAVQNHFTQRVVDMLTHMGKRVIGWDEVLHTDMPDMIVQNWRGATTRDRAAELGLSSIVSAPYYIDLFYPLDMHYRFDPAASQIEWLAAEDAQQGDIRLRHVQEGIEWTKQWRREAVTYEGSPEVLGGEACLWSELVDLETLETRLWSRLPGFAERMWCGSDPHADQGGEADQKADTKTELEDLYRRAEHLLNQAPYDLEARQRRQLAALGLDDGQVEVAMLLEPVKWYGRLLGAEALEARIAGTEMPQARPYQVTTPLNRVVDLIAPESYSARHLPEGDGWQTFIERVFEQQVERWPQDVQPAIEGLQTFARHLQSGDMDQARAEALYVPYGEFMLAPVYIWMMYDRR